MIINKTNGSRTNFWQAVRPSTLREFHDVYQLDFELFDYSFEDSLVKLGVDPPGLGSNRDDPAPV